MRKSQTHWAQRQVLQEGISGATEKAEGPQKERRPMGLLWREVRSERGQGTGPGSLTDLGDDCDFSGCADRGSYTGKWHGLTHSLER